MATGSVTVEDCPYIEQMISVSEYSVSGAFDAAAAAVAAISRIYDLE